jgi:putative membrane protein
LDRAYEQCLLSDPQREAGMRWLYLTLIVVFVLAMIIFAVQNLEQVTMSFLGFRLHAPLALLSAIVYLVGAVTGGSLYALLRRSVRESGLTGARTS